MNRIENKVNHIDMKRVIIVFATLLLLASCWKKGEKADPSTNDPQNTTENTVKAFEQPHIDGDPQSDEYVIARVNAIYDNIFKENYPVIGEDGEEILPSDDTPSPDEKFFTKDWNDLLSKVYEYESANNPDGQGLLDFDYWAWLDPDEEIGKLSISDVSVVKRDKECSVVELSLNNKGNKTHVRLELKFERGEWYIDNLINLDDNNYDMRKKMNEYLKKN